MRTRDLFLSSKLSSQEVHRLLERHGFQDTKQADQYLQRIVEKVGLRKKFAEWGPFLLNTLSQTVDPDAALLHLTTFFESTPNTLHLFSYLRESPSALHLLLQVLGASSFLSSVFLYLFFF